MRTLPNYGLIAGLLLLTVNAGVATAQMPARAESRTLSEEEQRAVIGDVVEQLREGYVFPEVAEAMEDEILHRFRNGEYGSVTSSHAFADSLTRHLQAVSNDRHLRVRYEGEGLQTPSPNGPPSSMIASWRGVNFGFEEVRRLPGNVGYLEVRAFMAEEYVAETAAAAMNFLAHTDALIVDLRRNGGGSPSTVAHLVSYFLPADSILINTIYSRPEDETAEFWNRLDLEGARYGTERPVYVLTSSSTFSGGEEFAYDLKHLERALIVGEVTGGGANPVRPQRVAEGFVVDVPTGRAINPITQTNWEGKGVAPHVEVARECALEVAHWQLLEQLYDDADALGQRRLRMAMDEARAALESVQEGSCDFIK